jgi:hypothetical protein
MPSNGIELTIHAQTEEAAARIKEFFSGVGEHLNELSGASEFLSEWGQRIAAAFTIGAIVDFTKEAINLAEAMGKLQQQTGLSIETLNGLQRAAGELGVSFDQVHISIGLFSDRIYTAVRQGGFALKTFHDLGVTLLDARGAMLSTDAILNEVADKFHAMADGPQKAQAATELFGRSGRELIPILNQGAEGIDEMRIKWGEFTPDVVKATEFNRAFRELREQFEEVARTLAQELLPSLKVLVDLFREVAEHGTAVRAILAAIGQGCKEATLGVVVANAAISAFAQNVRDEFSTIGTILVNLWKDISTTISAFVDLAQGAAAAGIVISEALSGNVLKAGKDLKTLIQVAAQDIRSIGKAVADATEGTLSRAADLTDRQTERWKKAIEEVSSTVSKLWPAVPAGANAPGGAGTASPTSTGFVPQQSDQAKQLILEIDKLYAEATQGRIALLDREEAEVKRHVEEEIIDEKTKQEELLKLEKAYEIKRKEIRDQTAAEINSIALSRINHEKQLTASNSDLTDPQKRELTLRLLEQENVLLQRNVELYRQRSTDASLSPEARLEASRQLGDSTSKLQATQQDQRLLAELGTFSGELKRIMVTIQNEWDSWAKQLAASLKNVFDSSISTISKNLTDVIKGTKTWGDALKDIGNTILTTVINAIVEMGVRWIATQIAMAVFGKSIAAASTAALVPIAAAQSAILAEPAALSEIASYGGASAAAPTGIAAAIAATQAISAGSAGFLSAKAGGFTGLGDPNEVAGIMHRGEFVFSAPAVDRIGVANLESLHRGASVPSGTPRGNGGSGVNNHIAIGVINDRSDVPAWARSNVGEKHIVDLVRRNWHRISK